MAKDYEILEYMHNSIYKTNLTDKPYSERKAKIYFSQPDAGINKETGIILFIAGYGGNANSNIYKKMREQFADKYNVVTIQCDYFGYEFMQKTESIEASTFDFESINKIFTSEELKEIYPQNRFDFNKFLLIGSKYNIRLNVREDLSGETLENFNDMGVIQALDNISSVLRVMSIIYDNGFEFNTKKVIIYGQSHGAYLSYLCNRFCPGLFTNIIDNSSWLFPQYLLCTRCQPYKKENFELNIQFDYLARRLDIDDKILDLDYLYSNFRNNCNIISYHGVTDNLINHKQKKEFCEMIDNCIYNEITDELVDGKVFKSTEHGLDSDFIYLFDYAYNKVIYEKDTILNFPEQVIIDTERNKYVISYKDILPIFTVI
ncbi:MAG: DUF2920 family protein [Solirubrobacterales bacterium]